MQKLVKSVSVSLCVAAAIAACSGGGTNPTDGGTSDSGAVDSGKKPLPEAGPADAAVACTADMAYTNALTNETATYFPTPADAAVDAGPEDSYQFLGSLNTDTDFLDLELYDGYGVFTGGIQPGTYNLSGDELDYATCGLCALVATDGSSLDTTQDVYMATAGTITITTVTPTLAGTITNLKFTHVSIDGNTLESTPLNDGCNSGIASATFTASVTTKN